jgi:hypothetical protein
MGEVKFWIGFLVVGLLSGPFIIPAEIVYFVCAMIYYGAKLQFQENIENKKILRRKPF